MKPNFALTLSFEGISLLHRALQGWELVGEVPLDSNELPGELAKMRALALVLEPGELQCKLVLPNDQIKYLTLTTAAEDFDTRDQMAREALEGETPYAVDDLAIDWAADGDHILIAAVALETLQEAENFASDNGFGPLCFVACPEPDMYVGEPYFGLSEHALKTLGADAQIDRDGAPIRVIGMAKLPEPDPEPELEEKAEVVTPEAAKEGDPPAGGTERLPTKTEQSESVTDNRPEMGTEDDRLSATARLTPTEQPDSIVQTQSDEENAADHTSAPTIAFASIRAERKQAPDRSAPRLNGAGRGAASATAPSIPIDPADTLAAQPVLTPTARASTRIVEDDPATRFEPTSPPKEASRRSFFGRQAKNTAANTGASGQSEAQRLTRFGARQPIEIRGKPKHFALILMLVLLLFLAAVAAWASIFVEDGLARLFWPRQSETITASLPSTAEDELTIEGEEAMLPDAEATAALAAERLETLSTSTDNAVFEALSEPEPTMTADMAQARYAVSGIWQMAPDVPVQGAEISLENLYVASIDAALAQADAVALPTLSEAETDLMLARRSDPVAPGTKFTLDSRGLVVATAAGALSPDGITIFLGRPPLTPAAFPQREADTTDVEVANSTENNRLAGFRPKPRPGDLVEQNERSTLGGLSRSELAAFRPKPRPEQNPAKVVEELDATGTARAVAESVKPKGRPANFSKAVERALKQAQATQTARKSTNTREPEPEVKVAVSAVKPKIPTSASVAKQATVRKAINLRKVNLIGVYGKSSSRRALVRLSNGRYQKVKVGDRIDGGRVAAIGETELRYTKNGRNVVLRMPKG